jgi:hypothetical protein
MSQQRNSLQRSSTLAEAEDLHRRIVSQERLTRDATARWASVHECLLSGTELLKR